MNSISFYGPLPIVFSFGALQGLILSVLLWLKKGNRISGRLIALFIGSFTLPTLNFALFNSSLGMHLGPRILMEPCTFLSGPVFYLFILHQVKKRNPKPIDIFHFLPFIVFMLWEIFFFTGFFSNHFLYEELNAVSAIVYAFLIYREIKESTYCNSGFKSLPTNTRIIIYCYAAYVLFFAACMVMSVFQISGKMMLMDLLGFFIIVCIYLIGHLSFWKQAQVTSPKQTQEKYAHSVLSEEMTEKIKAGLHELISAKIYLRANLKVEDIARELNTSPRYISQVINNCFGVSFPDFISEKRVLEAQRIIIESRDNPKLLAVAFDSGFSTKVSFFKSFKKKTGLTPKQFKEQISKPAN